MSQKFRSLKGLGILAGTEYPDDRPVRRETPTLVTETAGKATARRETFIGWIRDFTQRSPVTYDYRTLDPRLGPESGNLEHCASNWPRTLPREAVAHNLTSILS